MIAQPYTDLTPRELLALCDWRESDDQPVECMRAVAHVVGNRAAHPGWWGHDIVSVILKPWQFSSFDHGNPDERRWPDDANPQWNTALSLADEIINHTGPADPTSGATYYYDVSINPPWWTAKMIFCGQFGKVRFYKEPPVVVN